MFWIILLIGLMDIEISWRMFKHDFKLVSNSIFTMLSERSNGTWISLEWDDKK